jgi:hypothetical protein
MTELEHLLTHAHKAKMVAWIEAHPENFEEMIQLALSDKLPYSWRSAWLLWDCMEPNDPRVSKYAIELTEAIKGKADNQVRELFKILQMIYIDGEAEGKLFDIAVEYWTKINKKPAVRLNAFKVILKIVEKNPELYDELSFLVEEHYLEDLSPGVKHSINKMIKTLKLT